MKHFLEVEEALSSSSAPWALTVGDKVSRERMLDIFESSVRLGGWVGGEEGPSAGSLVGPAVRLEVG